MERLAWILSGIFGLVGVGLGAFGAHGLRPVFERAADAAKRLEWWQTATLYHLVHALALGLTAVLCGRGGGAPAAIATWAFVVGILLFCGSLDVMALTGARWLGAVTPLGGVAFLVGWAAVIVAATRLTRF